MIYSAMKKIIKRISIVIAVIVAILALWLFSPCRSKAVDGFMFGILFGNIYSNVGSAILTVDGEEESLPVYKAHNKPFILLGPYQFGNDTYDFFFVSCDQVAGGAVDKGGDAWTRIGKKLFMADDLSGDQIMCRAPIWDWMHDENSTLEFNAESESYIYSFDCYINEKHRRISLAVPQKFFTQDMLEAYNYPRELFKK